MTERMNNNVIEFSYPSNTSSEERYFSLNSRKNCPNCPCCPGMEANLRFYIGMEKTIIIFNLLIIVWIP